jgi:hypothetical protein
LPFLKNTDERSISREPESSFPFLDRKNDWACRPLFACNDPGWVADNHRSRRHVANDHGARTRNGARTNCDAWPNVSLCCHPGIFTNYYWSGHKSESQFSMIVGCGTKKGSLTYDRVVAEHNLVDAVAIDASGETTSGLHDQIPGCPNSDRRVRMCSFTDLSTKKPQQESTPAKERRR